MPDLRICTCIVAALLVPTAVAAADVYRWTDAQGIVHYSDQPHPGAEAVTVDPGTVPQSQDGGTSAGAGGRETPSKAERAAAIRAEQCRKAKKRLTSLRNAATVTTTGEDGEKRELSADERVQAIARAEKDVAGLCNSEG